MSKSFRQGQILNLIRTKNILTQDDLAHELKKLGILHACARLSRRTTSPQVYVLIKKYIPHPAVPGDAGTF